MVDVKGIEKQTGRTVAEAEAKEGMDGVYAVVFDNNLKQRWQLKGKEWVCIG